MGAGMRVSYALLTFVLSKFKAMGHRAVWLHHTELHIQHSVVTGNSSGVSRFHGISCLEALSWLSL